MINRWFSLSVEEIIKELNSSYDGLSKSEAQKRLKEFGPNRLLGKDSQSWVVILLTQFLNPLVYLLIAASLVKFFLGGMLDASVIWGIILIMVIIGFIQEVRAKNAMEALKQLAAPKAKVRRDGKTVIVASEEIVLGDVVLLEAGDMIPADARLIEAFNLKVNESALTGESLAVDKNIEKITKDISVADRKNMVHTSTTVVYGRGKAIVVATGMLTEIGKIATAIQNVKPEKTPLQKSIHSLGLWMIVIVLSALFIFGVVGVVRGLGWVEVFMLGVASSVAAIPEGLPATVTVVLAAGMRLMAKRNAIIRKLVAVETLGSATVICTDKTGTLTLNQMTVKKVFVEEKLIDYSGESCGADGKFSIAGRGLSNSEIESIKKIFNIGVLCNNAEISNEEGKCRMVGDPTETSILSAGLSVGVKREEIFQKNPRENEIPFQSEKQYMAVLHNFGGKRIVYVKGSPEKILSFSNQIYKDGRSALISDQDKNLISKTIDDMAGNAMRLIAMAYCEHDDSRLDEDSIRGKLVFMGLVGIIDPPRPDAIKAVSMCKKAGIRVVMVTGDNKLTARAIANEVGIDSMGGVLTGSEVEKMSDEEIGEKVKTVSVFARIEPLHKLKIVHAFKGRGDVVAMTGDGVNDAPALEAADIGVSMGVTGTDVAKESSDMVLADDNFASVVAAVEEGRAIFNNLRNATSFLLTTCFGELSVLILSVVFLGVAPLLPLQILWINLVTGAIMAIPLGLEPKVGNELLLPPRHPRVGLIFPGMLMRVAFLSSMLGVGSFLVFYWSYERMSIEEARTMVFCSISFFEWLVAFNCRSDEITIFKLGVFKNKTLLAGVAFAIFLQLIVLYVPILRIPFGNIPLGISGWIVLAIPAVFIFLLETLRKAIVPDLFGMGKWIPQIRGRKI